MQIKGCLLFIFITCHFFAFSQTRHFQHLTNEDGISQSEVYTIFEDSRGFMWFGTVDGLNQYDGYNVTIFNTDKKNPNSISNNTVRSLAEDNFGRIWIGTNDGLCVYNPLSEKIVYVKIACVEPNILLQIRSIIVDKNHILLGTTSGLLSANINTTNLDQIGQEFKWVNYSANHRASIYDALKHKDGSIWIVTSDALHGMVFQRDSDNPLIIESVADKRFINNMALKDDKFGNIWIATHGNGFCRYNPSKKVMNHFFENVPNSTVVSSMFSDIATDRNNNLWISSREKGLLFLEANRLNDENPQFENIHNVPSEGKSLNSNLIYSLYVSKNNLLWVGTIGAGINIYDSQQKEFNHIKIPLNNNQIQPSSNFIRSVYYDDDDNIWLGTQNNGLHIYNRKSKTFSKAGFGNNSIFYIYNIGDGNILLCKSGGVSIVKRVNNEIKSISYNFSKAFFYSCKSKNEIVWLANLAGITKWRLINGNLQKEKEYNQTSSPGISFNNCRVLFYDEQKNELLAGTEGGGLNILKLDGNHNAVSTSVYKKSNSANSISNNYIRSITKDSDGAIWIGTFEGLNKLLRDQVTGEITFKNYTKHDGLPNNMIQSIVEDSEKKLWLGTNRGLSRFDPESEQFVNYSVNDGLQSFEFSEHTAFKTPDGEIIIGGINGINIFYPDNLMANTTPPKTTITGFYIFNKKAEISESKKRTTPLRKSIVLTDSLLLKPSETSFGFDFSAMLHSYSGKVKYAYKLEGFDNDWNYTDSKNRRANYTRLKYGKYVFMVKSTNADGIWEKTPRSIYIHIKTPFVYTPIAFVMYILVIILIIIYFTNYSVIKYTTKKNMLLENEHIKKVHELDELRTRFFINISHDLRTPLTLISSPLEIALKTKNLSTDVRNYLNITLKNVKKLKYITEQLLDIRKAEASNLTVKLQTLDIISFIKTESTHFTHAIKNKGLDFFVLSNESAIYTAFDTDMISKVFFNLMSNAIKYTHQGGITIHIEKKSQKLPERLKNSTYNSFIRIDFQDSGEGIDPQELNKIFDRFYQGKGKSEKGYGIGLSHCKDLIEALGGDIEAFSEKGVGTTISFLIPEIKAEVNQPETEFIAAKTGDIYVEPANDLTIEDYLPDNASLKKILIIEDNADMRNFIRNELKREYKVFEANDGSEGLKMAEKYAPDLIVSDIMMPNMDGIEFCKIIKSNISTSHIPLILLTAKVDTPTKYEGIEKGADDYISKPFEMEYLLLRIKNILKSREQLRQLFQKSSSFDPSAVTVTSLDEKFLSQLLKAIEDGIPDPEFTVNLLKSTMGMSHSNFYRKIKNLTGQNGKEILFSMRMKRARQILTDNQGIRISEVAYMVGYSNPKYFSQSFKVFYGVLPSEITS